MKTIIWDTNFNGKLHCSRFAHVDLAPAKMPPQADLEKAVFTITTADSSHQPVHAKVEAIIPFRLAELSNIHTWPSHGMDTAEFMEWQHRKKKVDKDTVLAVYYYKKVAVN